jgi:uncharacterized protein YukE
MTTFQGLDVDVVQQQGKALKAQAQQLESIIGNINGLVSNLVQVWNGPDAQRFEGWWHQQHRPALSNASHAIDGLGQSALNNASEQSHASSTSGGTSGGGAASAGMAVGTAGIGAAALGAVAGAAGGAAASASFARGPQAISNSAIAAAAESELRTHPGAMATGWNQPGECMVSAQRWVEEAGGHVNRNGQVAGSYSGVAAQVPLAQAQRGDIIQYVDPANPNGDWEHVHTLVITGPGSSPGTFNIIERNYDFHGGIREVTNWTPKPAAGWEARAYRYGNQP